jgi:hypothetical protein
LKEVLTPDEIPTEAGPLGQLSKGIHFGLVRGHSNGFKLKIGGAEPRRIPLFEITLDQVKRFPLHRRLLQTVIAAKAAVNRRGRAIILQELLKLFHIGFGDPVLRHMAQGSDALLVAAFFVKHLQKLDGLHFRVIRIGRIGKRDQRDEEKKKPGQSFHMHPC